MRASTERKGDAQRAAPSPSGRSRDSCSDDVVAEKAPPCEDSEVGQSRADEVQGPAVRPVAAGDESDSSQMSSFEWLCRAASRREWRKERALPPLPPLLPLLGRLRMEIDRFLVLECR